MTYSIKDGEKTTAWGARNDWGALSTQSKNLNITWVIDQGVPNEDDLTQISMKFFEKYTVINLAFIEPLER